MDPLETRMAEVLQGLPEAECLLTIPGVGPVSAAVFLGLVGDPQAYESSAQVLKLAGLSLVERSSGVQKGQVHLSKRGKPSLRRQMFMLALAAVRGDGIYHQRFQNRLARKGNAKRSILVALSRDMLCLMFSIAKERRHYSAQPPQRSARAELRAAS